MIPRAWRPLGACAMLLGCPKDPDAVNPLPADVVTITDDGVADAVAPDAHDVAVTDARDVAVTDASDVTIADAPDVTVADAPDVPAPDVPTPDVPTPDVPDAGVPSPVRVTGAIRALGVFVDPARSLRVAGTLESVSPACDRTRGICITGAITP